MRAFPWRRVKIRQVKSTSVTGPAILMPPNNVHVVNWTSKTCSLCARTLRACTCSARMCARLTDAMPRFRLDRVVIVTVATPPFIASSSPPPLALPPLMTSLRQKAVLKLISRKLRSRPMLETEKTFHEINLRTLSGAVVVKARVCRRPPSPTSCRLSTNHSPIHRATRSVTRVSCASATTSR